MMKKFLFAIVLVLSFCLTGTFSTVHAKSEKADDKGKDTETVEKIKKNSDDEGNDKESFWSIFGNDDEDDNGKDKKGKVTICHYPSGDKEKGQTISISSNAAEKHMEHGDTYGACSGDDEGEIEKKLKSWWEFWK